MPRNFKTNASEMKTTPVLSFCLTMTCGEAVPPLFRLGRLGLRRKNRRSVLGAVGVGVQAILPRDGVAFESNDKNRTTSLK